MNYERLCKISLAHLAVYSAEWVILFVLLAMILYMTVKYTKRSDTEKQFLMLYHAGGDSSDLTKVEAERIQHKMAERLAKNNARLAEEFLAIIIAQIRQEELEEEEEPSGEGGKIIIRDSGDALEIPNQDLSHDSYKEKFIDELDLSLNSEE